MPSASLALIVSSVRLAESWGRGIVVDLGFGAALDRFERAFGKHITNLILALIGLATATICCAIIWELALGPAVAWLMTIMASAADQASDVAAVALYAAGAALGFWGSSYATARFERRKVVQLREETRKLLEERDALAEEIASIDAALDEAGV